MARKITKLYLAASLFEDQQVHLQKEHLHYLCKVLRKKTGDQFVALDGQGRAWLCQLGPDELGTKVDDFPVEKPLALKLSVGLGLCKNPAFEDAIEKLAELGVEELIPMHTHFSERGELNQGKWNRWHNIAQAASALAGRSIPLKLQQPRNLREIVASYSGNICCCHPDGQEAKEVFGGEAKRLLLLVGPEAGFAQADLVELPALSQRLSLGRLNLRVETAATLAAGLAINLSS